MCRVRKNRELALQFSARPALLGNRVKCSLHPGEPRVHRAARSFFQFGRKYLHLKITSSSCLQSSRPLQSIPVTATLAQNPPTAAPSRRI